MAVKAVTGRQYLVTINDDGFTLDFGPAASMGTVGTYVFQFNPDPTWNGTFQILGRTYGVAAQSLSMGPVPIPYRLISSGGAASASRAPVATLITGPCIIEVPASGLAVQIQTQCSSGTCGIVGWDLEGSSCQ